jgi:hypothetical protein
VGIHSTDPVLSPDAGALRPSVKTARPLGADMWAKSPGER